MDQFTKMYYDARNELSSDYFKALDEIYLCAVNTISDVTWRVAFELKGAEKGESERKECFDQIEKIFN